MMNGRSGLQEIGRSTCLGVTPAYFFDTGGRLGQ